MRLTNALCSALVFAGVAALVVLTLITAIDMAGAGDSPSPSPSAAPTATPTPIVACAPLSVVRWAMRWRHAAVRSYRVWSRARTCLSMHHRPFASPRPARRADKARWMTSGRHWRHMRRDYRQRTRLLVAHMNDPGGGGAARWWPAARWCGWPQSLKGWFCYIVQRESSGRVHAVNPSSGCYGLLQLHPCHWERLGLAWISNVFNQLRMGWRLYRECGASPWAL